jgi:two-component system NtrC family response regulator
MILIIDDDDSITTSLGLLLKQSGYQSLSASTPAEALDTLEQHDISLVLQDMNFSCKTTGEEGMELLARIKTSWPDLPVILMTAWGTIELAVAGLKAGAADFVTKPWTKAQILQSVQTALGLSESKRRAVHAGRLTRHELDERYDFSGIIGENPKMIEVLDLLGRVSGTDASVLISGDSGTGKEVVAEAIHRNSPRRKRSFVKVNLGGIPISLFESEMFGHVRGAFTDAHRDRQGRFEMADGGTILLDEIGELDLRSQVKLLRVLQDRTYEVLGTSDTRTLDVRVISATNRNLVRAVEEGRFREDLLYRLNLITVHLPSLAERTDDIPRLTRRFLALASESYGGRATAISDTAIKWLQSQHWPGNIRQLKHLIERTVLVTNAPILEPEHFRRTIEMDKRAGTKDRLPPVGSMTVGDIEKSMILKSIEYHDGNLTRVAKSLGLSRAALYRRLDKYGIKQ